MKNPISFIRRHFLAMISGGAAAVCSPSFAKGAKEERSSWNEVFDVVVIGSGGAGLTAAIEVADAGSSCVVLEKCAVIGGNTRLADAMNAVDPEQQAKQGIEDSIEKHTRQTLSNGAYRADPKRVERVTASALETLNWLKAQGVEFADEVYQVYSSLWPRTHNTVRPAYEGYIAPLVAGCEKRGVAIRPDHQVVRIIREEDGSVLGVEVETGGETRRIRALKGVVVAAGGFSANAAMRSKYNPKLASLHSTNHSGATGDLFGPLEDIGAALIDMEFFQLLPGSARNGQFVGAISPIESVIMVNRNGERFIAEDAPGDEFINAVLASPGNISYLIRDAKGYREGMKPTSREAFDRGLAAGDTFSASSLKELALKIQVPSENLIRTIDKYNKAVFDRKRGVKDAAPDEFGRSPETLQMPIQIAPFYAARIAPSVNVSLGGLSITEDAEVLDRRGCVIPHLYAAGEVTGGFHGASMMGGNSLTEVFVMGRIAGKSASK